MKGEVKSTLRVVAMYASTVIGAGFASGKEIVRFFTSYYQGGFWGIILAGFLFSVIGCIVLNDVFQKRIRSYEEFLFPAVGWHLGWIMEFVVSLFMLSVFSIMTAGSAKVLESTFHMPFKYSVFIMASVNMFFLLFGIKGLMVLSSVLTPILIAGITLIGFYIILFRDIEVLDVIYYIKPVTDNWFFSALLYVSYNSILSVVIMCSLLPYLKTRRAGIVGGLLGGAVLCVIAIVLNYAISIYSPDSLLKDLPVLEILKEYGTLLSLLYSFILWIAMLVCAVTSGYGFMERISCKISIDRKLITVFSCVFIVPFSMLGFSRLIAFIYPIFGYVGMFMVFIILLNGAKTLKMSFVKRD